MPRPRACWLAVPLACWSPSARATWSIVATDARTSEVGGAVTSCVGAYDVSVVTGVAPGHGAIHAQAYVNIEARDAGVEMLLEDRSPSEVIAAITDAAFDVGASARQYGVVDLQGRFAGFTGGDTEPWTGDRQSADDRYTWSTQGNILTGEGVVARTHETFAEAGGCDLADQLMRALEAGAAEGEGDSRCTPDGLPSDAASLRVVDASGVDVVALSVTATAPESAVVSLRAGYDAWRGDHACPEPVDTGGTDTGDAKDTGDAGCGCRADPGSAGPRGLGLGVGFVVAALLRRRLRRSGAGTQGDQSVRDGARPRA